MTDLPSQRSDGHPILLYRRNLFTVGTTPPVGTLLSEYNGNATRDNGRFWIDTSGPIPIIRFGSSVWSDGSYVNSAHRQLVYASTTRTQCPASAHNTEIMSLGTIPHGGFMIVASLEAQSPMVSTALGLRFKDSAPTTYNAFPTDTNPILSGTPPGVTWEVQVSITFEDFNSYAVNAFGGQLDIDPFNGYKPKTLVHGLPDMGSSDKEIVLLGNTTSLWIRNVELYRINGLGE